MQSGKEGGFFGELVKVIIQAGLIALVVRTLLFQPFNIPSGSMIPTLDIGDFLFVSKYAYGYSNHSLPFSPPLFNGRILFSPPKRGDVVVFKLPSDGQTDYIKRVIGLPGDHVTCCNALGEMSVNGTPLDEPYVLKQAGTSAVSLTSFDVVVPPGDLWVMGDNRYDSKDSRYQTDTPDHGFVPEKDVVGRAFVISWPISRWTVLSNYPNTFSGVGPPSK